MKQLFLLVFLNLSLWSSAQTYEYVYRNPQDSSYNCYLKVIPEADSIRGLIVRDFTRLPDATVKSPYRFTDLALENDLMVIYTTTSDFYPELYYNDTGPALLDEIVNEVLVAHNIPVENIFIGGISASGTRALRYAQYCEEGKSKYEHKVSGVFVVDSPLDLERFYWSSDNILKRDEENGMLEESKLMQRALPLQLDGSPNEVPENYIMASVFSKSAADGGNARHYKGIPIILYCEPDMNWWIDQRSATYYDINAYDIVGFVRELRSMGNKDVTLITTSNKGFDRKGNRKPHSWTIVDEPELMSWIRAHLKK